MSISYRTPDKSDFVKHIGNFSTETVLLDKQGCYLLENLNINLSMIGNIFLPTKFLEQATKTCCL